ncbi:MAG: hypothetical protein ABIS17_08680 [Casimicrobiaceae bacterium]
MRNDPGSTENRRTVGVYDRPTSADRPKARPFAIAAIVIVLVVVAIYVLRHY